MYIIIKEKKRGKAAGLDGQSVEHLRDCHSLLPGVLARLSNLIIKIGHVPVQFGLSYTVLLVEVNGCTKNLSVDDLRGVSIKTNYLLSSNSRISSTKRNNSIIKSHK